MAPRCIASRYTPMFAAHETNFRALLDESARPIAAVARPHERESHRQQPSLSDHVREIGPAATELVRPCPRNRSDTITGRSRTNASRVRCGSVGCAGCGRNRPDLGRPDATFRSDRRPAGVGAGTDAPFSDLILDREEEVLARSVALEGRRVESAAFAFERSALLVGRAAPKSATALAMRAGAGSDGFAYAESWS